MFRGISNDIQNDLIQALLSAIKWEINEVSLLDETSDVTNNVQFFIVLHHGYDELI